MISNNFRELEKSRHQESFLRSQLKEKEAAKTEIEDKFSSLQEEAAAKTKKLRRVWNELNEAKAELKVGW